MLWMKCSTSKYYNLFYRFSSPYSTLSSDGNIVMQLNVFFTGRLFQYYILCIVLILKKAVKKNNKNKSPINYLNTEILNSGSDMHPQRW